jgi:hypothetical protein
MTANAVDHALNAGESNNFPNSAAAFVYTPCKIVSAVEVGQCKEIKGYKVS